MTPKIQPSPCRPSIRRLWPSLAGLVLLFPAAVAANLLAPLSTNEMDRAVGALRANGILTTNCNIASLSLLEPPKESLETSPRIARAVLVDHAQQRSLEADIELTTLRLLRTTPITQGQPMETFKEFTTATETVRADTRWQTAIAKRGITNYSDVTVNVWAGGHHVPPGPRVHRFARALSYIAAGQSNTMGRPIEGVEAIVDLDKQRVVHVVDTGVRKVPAESTDFFNPAVRGTNRAALKPLIVTQPEGPSFSATDHEVAWDRWRLRWSFNAHEGLVLHQVRYVDGGRERSILYRASISEMLVPYGSPEQTWFWRNAVDEGEYGLGHCASELSPGQTIPAHASLFDVAVCSNDGEVSLSPRRVGIHERHGESLWSHTDTPNTVGRLSRELVLTFIATVGNYDYRYSWVFRQDGTLEFEVWMTGILLMAGSDQETCAACLPTNPPAGIIPLQGDERFGTLVAKNTIAVNHQHFVNVRLDFDVDGSRNAIKEINARPLGRGRSNPHANAWVAEQRVFDREREARRDLSPATARHWAVFNPEKRTALGHYPAYMLEPGGNARPMGGARMRGIQVLGFPKHAIHATQYHPEEVFAGGDYPNQLRKPDNVEVWGENNESIRNADVVIWYTLAMTHIPRPEEFPVMPSARTSFRLVPKAFFDRNPALDVPLEPEGR